MGDITKTKLPQADAILLLHVLHHLISYKQQEELLQECYQKITKNGKLIIVEVEPKISYKYLLTWLVDHFLVSWIFDKKLYSPIYFRKSKEWTEVLNNLGLKTKVRNMEKNKPFSHILIEASKI
jgi:2-polyprenyl-3-methyl-5-hydroxy-6-metoxy-1,4-benzoquinol methylase